MYYINFIVIYNSVKEKIKIYTTIQGRFNIMPLSYRCHTLVVLRLYLRRVAFVRF